MPKDLGEAVEIKKGLWPANRTVSQHASARAVVPTLPERLDGVRTTFFVEGWNAAVSPYNLRWMAEHGHDIGQNGWRHEVWTKQDEAALRSIVQRSVAALHALGIDPRGMRPPEGERRPQLVDLLCTEGLTYHSDAGTRASLDADVARLLFGWRSASMACSWSRSSADSIGSEHSCP